MPPAREQRGASLRHGDIEVEVTTIVLREVDAAVLLLRPETACFALGADDHGRGDEALCADAVTVLRTSGASLRRFQFAAAAARAHGAARFDAMLRAVNAQGVQAVIIEDLVKIGEDIGMERGVVEGAKKGFRTGILALCSVLCLRIDEERRAALDTMEAPELEALMNRLQATRAW